MLLLIRAPVSSSNYRERVESLSFLSSIEVSFNFKIKLGEVIVKSVKFYFDVNEREAMVIRMYTSGRIECLSER